MTTLLNAENAGLTTTFNELHEWRACKPSYKKLAKELGGIKAYGRTTPIKLSQVLDICGFDDCFWVLEKVTLNKSQIREIRLFGCDCAERVLHIFESEHPNDHRPRQAIEAAQRYARNEIGREELTLARDAAWDAAWAADRDAARAADRDAAWDAAWDAARAADRAAARAARAARAAAGDAWDAARDAWDAGDAGDAERAAQTQMLRDVLLKLEAGVSA